jgi:protein gp37
MTLTHIEWTDATWNPVTGCTKVPNDLEMTEEVKKKRRTRKAA